MTNDSKLGLLAGLAGVVVIAVVYYQKPAVANAAAPPQPAAVSLAPASMTPALIVTGTGR
jgi:hypothetical protein